MWLLFCCCKWFNHVHSNALCNPMLKLHTIETLVYAKNLIYFWAQRRRHRPKDLCVDRTAALRHKWWRGTCWRELGPKLDIPAAKIPQNLDEDFRCNRDKANALLLMWKQKEGRSAVAGCLADALLRIWKKCIAEKLLGKLVYLVRWVSGLRRALKCVYNWQATQLPNSCNKKKK